MQGAISVALDGIVRAALLPAGVGCLEALVEADTLRALAVLDARGAERLAGRRRHASHRGLRGRLGRALDRRRIARATDRDGDEGCQPGDRFPHGKGPIPAMWPHLEKQTYGEIEGCDS